MVIEENIYPNDYLKTKNPFITLHGIEKVDKLSMKILIKNKTMGEIKKNTFAPNKTTQATNNEKSRNKSLISFNIDFVFRILRVSIIYRNQNSIHYKGLRCPTADIKRIRRNAKPVIGKNKSPGAPMFL